MSNGLDTERITELEKQLAEKDKFIQDMIKKAANNHLGGYREMGKQLAEKDMEIDRLRAQNRCPYSHYSWMPVCNNCGWTPK